MRGFALSDLRLAFVSVEIQAQGTNCQKPFFHCYTRFAPGEARDRETWLYIADREEKLDRREKELARMRERPKQGATANGGTQQAGEVEGIDKAIAKLEGDRERLEARLTALAHENKRLKTDLATFETAKPAQAGDARRAGAALREQMNELAAEVVNLTMKLDGPDSPIAKALAARRDGRQDAGERGISLADRVRALQKANSTS